MPPGSAAKSEEGGAAGPAGELPFLNVHRYLVSLGVRVPTVHRYDEAAAAIVLEDLGDVTFERSLAGADRAEAYRGAVRLLARLRARAEERADPSCVAFGRRFDAALYEWELHHFREWGLERWSAAPLTPADRASLDEAFRELAARLARLPVGFTHRDFQSRNLMVVGGELAVIDFQDALLGPRAYDLVALLRDSYVELPAALVDELVDEYQARFAEESGEARDDCAFRAAFDLLTVQRKLKDAGRFEYIHRVKGNPSFLPSIAPSMRYARAALARLPELAGLRALVDRYLPEA
jgi:hypothetical protein